MRRTTSILAVLAMHPIQCMAQDKPPISSVTADQRKAVSDEKASEIKDLIKQAKIRQDKIDRQNSNLWARWTFAVCVGCSIGEAKVRTVHTYPLRVLAGIPAAMDDARERAGRTPI